MNLLITNVPFSSLVLKIPSYLHLFSLCKEFNEPLSSFVSQLDPYSLIADIPRDLGFSREVVKILSPDDDDDNDTSSVTPDETLQRQFINYAQFYHILKTITEIVYPDLSAEDLTVAFNKIIQESILPLFVWAQGHCKKGCTDPLLLEGRVALLMTTYGPNIWKVFLMYAQVWYAPYLFSVLTQYYISTISLSSQY